MAANLYLYLVPLAIFVRRSRELDFSANKSTASMQLVQRAFRIFSPALVDTLTRLLQGQSEWSHLVEKHRQVLDMYAPPSSEMTLVSLQKDMQSLLEAIDMEHSKKMREMDVFSRMFNSAQHWLGSGHMTVEERALDQLLQSARIICQVPLLDYNQFRNSSHSATGSDVTLRAPPRTPSGHLSKSGRELLLRGQVQCHPTDITYQGDVRRARPTSMEFSFLVEGTLLLSDWLNKKVWGEEEPKFLFDLRFLAHKRFWFWFAVVFFYKTRWFWLSRLGL